VEEALTSDVVRARDGDRDAFARVVTAFRDTAVATAYGWLGDREAALDASQDAFLDAFRLLGQLSDPKAFAGWLRRIVVKHCDRVSRRRVVATTALSDATSLSAANDPADAIDDADRAAALRVAVELLAPSARIVVALRYVAGMPAPAIASYLELPPTTVEHRLRAARRRLREVLTMNEPLMDVRPTEEFTDEIRLFLAVRAGDADAVRAMLAARPELAEAEENWDRDLARRGLAPHPQHGTPLVRAVERGDRKVIEALLDAGAAVDGACGCATGERPLWTAVAFGRADIARLLLERGAAPDGAIPSGVTALHLAAMRGDRELTDLLLAAGADPDARDVGGRTAADWVVAKMPTVGTASAHLETGIKAIELLCPVPRGGVIRQEPGYGMGHAVLLLELSYRLTARPNTSVVWCGFEQQPYDRVDLGAELREAGLGGRVPVVVAPRADGDAACRDVFANTVELSKHRALQRGEDVVLVVFEEIGFASAVEAELPSCGLYGDGSLSAIVAGPLRDLPNDLPPIAAPYDGRIVFDGGRASRGMWPAIGPSSMRRSDERSVTIDARAILASDDAFDTPVGSRLHAYLSQPFAVGEPFTATDATCVSRDQVLAEVESLLRGTRSPTNT
jgi:RNA polymerase sigma-70 factor (ECF subfamily)